MQLSLKARSWSLGACFSLCPSSGLSRLRYAMFAATLVDQGLLSVSSPFTVKLDHMSLIFLTSLACGDPAFVWSPARCVRELETSLDEQGGLQNEVEMHAVACISDPCIMQAPLYLSRRSLACGSCHLIEIVILRCTRATTADGQATFSLKDDLRR